jgi:hypothetical protein
MTVAQTIYDIFIPRFRWRKHGWREFSRERARQDKDAEEREREIDKKRAFCLGEICYAYDILLYNVMC